ncbi:hypothetical protein Pcinc_022060 [Petrolisthes cinctipes]|uniref:Uncharacterized protein n=1 Tax=Petrolisthes cinctipes TaxID=88211 RepID=A0AAE1FGA3_PETCI|nr:hypothetical protein Pcinc_022060 [Petrolisthes cinctipes]
MMVEELRVYCIRVIAKNVTEVTPLGHLSTRDLAEVCADLSPDLPLTLALSLPLTDLYWLRRARAHYPPPHVALQGGTRGSRGMEDGVHEGVPEPCPLLHPPRSKGRGGVGGGRKEGGGVVGGGWKRHITVVSLLQLCGQELTSLTLPSLPQQARKSEGVSGESATTSPDLPQLLHLLPRLQVLSLRYRDVSEGGSEGRGGGGGRGESSAGATLQEVAALASALTTATPALTQLRISESCLDDVKVEELVSGLRTHPALTSLDLRHNSLTSSSIPFLIDLITSIPLKLLNLQHNDIGVEGTELLSVALARTPYLSLEALLMDLNPLGSAGGVAILKGAAEGGRRGGRGGGGGDPPKEVVESAKASGARVLLSNLNGTTYFLGQVSRGRQLAPPLTGLQEHLARLPPLHDPLTQHLGPLPQLHGLHLHPKDFTLEEELRGMCLFTKNGNTIINSYD